MNAEISPRFLFNVASYRFRGRCSGPYMQRALFAVRAGHLAHEARVERAAHFPCQQVGATIAHHALHVCCGGRQEKGLAR